VDDELDVTTANCDVNSTSVPLTVVIAGSGFVDTTRMLVIDETETPFEEKGSVRVVGEAVEVDLERISVNVDDETETPFEEKGSVRSSESIGTDVDEYANPTPVIENIMMIVVSFKFSKYII
jgi:hypothetical protein